MRKSVIAAAILVLVVACSSGSSEPSTSLVAVPAALSSSSSSSSTTATSIATTTTSGADVVVEGVAETLELVSIDPAAAVHTDGVLGGLDLSVGFPPGAVIEFDPENLIVSGDVAEALVYVTLPDGQTDRFGVVLVPEGDQWLIAYTVLLP